MPVYEYICKACKKRFSVFLKSFSDTAKVQCAFCASEDIARIMSRFASIKSDEARLESLADPSKWSGIDENNPKSVADFVKRMGSELGEDVGRDEIEQMADEAAREAETGFSPSEAAEGPRPDADD
jgi:putative FmdB family regulatory protein